MSECGPADERGEIKRKSAGRSGRSGRGGDGLVKPPRTVVAWGRRRGDWFDLAEDIYPRIAAAGGIETEIGFGKGRYLLQRAQDDPNRLFVGIEIAGEYFRLAARRAERRGLNNLILVQGEAAFVLATLLPEGCCRTLHVYFPDPWPKARHHKRRLFDRRAIDFLIGALQVNGQLAFATDFVSYGAEVEALLRSVPALEVEVAQCWPEGARTNYEAKYEEEGRPILRLVATRLTTAIDGCLATDSELVLTCATASVAPRDALVKSGD